MRFTVEAGKTDRVAGPVCAAVKADEIEKKEALALIDARTKTPIPCQLTPTGQLCWWAGAMKAGESRVYELSPMGLSAAAPRIVVSEDHPEQVDIRVGNKAYTTYQFGDDQVRPYLYPVIGPTNVSVTRHYPMRPGVPGERSDHPHHESCWVAWGDINGTDHWSVSDKSGLQKHRKLLATVSGPVFGQLEAAIDWQTRAGKRQLTEQRTYRFWQAGDDLRMFDLTVKFHFTDGDVKFGDTKEGGLCSFRIAGTMKERSGGTVTNASGAAGARNCWGKPSPWVDYSGKVGDDTVGIAIFDHHDNFRHPTRWHVRDYGLFTANCFGLSYFIGRGNDGSHTWKNGQTVTFRYRVIIHKGNVEAGKVAGHYENYRNPRTVRVG